MFNKFSEKLGEYRSIRRAFKEKFEILLTRIIKGKEIFSNSANIEKVENIRYFESKYGKIRKDVSVYQLFFHSENLEDFLSQSKINGKFLLDFLDAKRTKQEKQIDRKDFDKIYKVINNRKYIFDGYLSQKDFQKIKDFHRTTRILKDRIRKTIPEVAKK